jgi:hypothetical protein
MFMLTLGSVIMIENKERNNKENDHNVAQRLRNTVFGEEIVKLKFNDNAWIPVYLRIELLSSAITRFDIVLLPNL